MNLCSNAMRKTLLGPGAFLLLLASSLSAFATQRPAISAQLPSSIHTVSVAIMRS